MNENPQNQALLHTPLYDLHREMGAKMVSFSGYEMPLQYSKGILKEHVHTREQASLFDVSHMGQLKIHGKNASKFLESLLPTDVIDLPLNQQRYSFFTNQQGGILDDLMISNNADHFFLVVNAACKTADFSHLQSHLIDDCSIEVMKDHALIALQGPSAKIALSKFAEISAMPFMSTARFEIDGINCHISRSGYTGEDGFEISVHNDSVETLVRKLLSQPGIELAGLGARDSLRLEAGLCLYGHDINTKTTPVEAKLTWAISPARRITGIRAGGYPGYEIITKLIQEGSETKRAGLLSKERVPIREGV
jgi:aminomethyltransferase